MTDEGAVKRVNMRSYEDLPSLKKYIKSRQKFDSTNGSTQRYYDPLYSVEYITNYNVTTTGATPDLIEADDGIAVAQIGKTELTLLLAGDADNASTNGKTYTLVYIDNDGTENTAVGTGTATLNGTPVAFVPAVTDFYAAVSFTASSADANVNVYAATAGIAAIYATIATTATEATEANMHGVGSLYGRTHTDHADGQGKVLQLEYLSGQGTIKYGHCTTHTTSTDEIRFFEGSYSTSTDTVTATTTTIKDFYRVRRLWTTTAPTANSHEFYICDSDEANDGSGGGLYGVILEGAYESVHTTYCPPYGYDAWIGRWCAQAAKSADADSYTFEIIYKQDGGSIYHTDVYEFTEYIKHEEPILLEEEEDVEFYCSDLATADVISGSILIVEAKRN